MDIREIEESAESKIEQLENAITKSKARAIKTTQALEISEAMRSAVERTSPKVTANGRIWGVKEQGKNRLTGKQRAFANYVAQGNAPKEAYKKAYNVTSVNEANHIANANKLMRDPRIGLLLSEVWEQVKENVIDDAIAVRRKVMGDLMSHANNEEARLSDRLKSLELMGRAIGMFTDKMETKTDSVNAEQLKRDLEQSLHLLDTMPKPSKH
jgi:Tfp pilus assembly protein FimT